MRSALLKAKLAIVKALRLVEIQKCKNTEVCNDHFIITHPSLIQPLDFNSIGSDDNFI